MIINGYRLLHVVVDYNDELYLTASVEQGLKSSLAGWSWLQSREVAVKMSLGLQSPEG